MHASYLWNVFLLVVSASMQNRFVSSKALHSQFAHSCIPKVYGQLFLDLVLAVSIIEAYLCMIEARALDETKRMAAGTKKSYVCVAGHSCKPKVVQICSLVRLCLKINPPGNKLNYSFFSKHVRPHPHIRQSWIDSGTAHFSKRSVRP